MEQERISISLEESSPSTFTAEDLRKQLHQIGLHCEQTSVENLQRHMDDVLNNLPDGSVQGVQMHEPEETSGEMAGEADSFLPCNIQSQWKPTDDLPCLPELYTIGITSNFDYLQEHYPGFSGKKASQHHENKGDTIDAFKQLFIQIAESISETLINDLDRAQMQAIFAHIIQPINPGSDDYDSGFQNRTIPLVDGYDPQTQTCAGFGVLNLEYRIIIRNYKDKSENKKNYLLDITVRTSLYRDMKELDNEIDFLKNPNRNSIGENWLINVSSDDLISDINIPGTHDCGTAYLKDDKKKKYQCQSLSVSDQMKIGVRYFDIRCNSKKEYGDTQYIYHDSVQCLNQLGNHIILEDLIHAGNVFLKNHPSETLIFQIKNEGDNGNDKKLCNYLGRYIKNGTIWAGTKIPTLKEVRGKIVLVRRFTVEKNNYHFTEDDFGINLSSWDTECFWKKDCNTFVHVNDNAWVQDRYLTGADSKLKLINKAVAEMNDEDKTPSKEWAICLSSCTNPTPREAADDINEKLLSAQSPLNKTKVGTFVVDFASEALISKIYNSNFKEKKKKG